MSIEKNIERIADALEKIAASMVVPEALVKKTKPKKEKPAPVVDSPVVTAAAPVVAPVVTTAAPVVAPPVAVAPVTTLSAEEMNTALVTEFKRLGGREQIDATLTSFGITSVNDCPAEKQQEVLLAIRALV